MFLACKKANTKSHLRFFTAVVYQDLKMLFLEFLSASCAIGGVYLVWCSAVWTIFWLPETEGMLVTAADCIVGGFILKNAIARSNHAISCTNPPGIATTVNAFIDTEP